MTHDTATTTAISKALQGETAARAFLSALGNAHTFQTFCDAKQGKTRPQILNGSYDDHSEQLQALNSQGAGIFVTVNATDGQGRTKANIMSPRALWLDFDNGEPDAAKLELLPEPSMIVQSRNGKHLYWLLADGESLEALPAALDTLVEFMGADRLAKGIARVMRVPGFKHCKAGPFDTVLLKCDASLRYSIAEVVAKVPALVQAGLDLKSSAEVTAKPAQPVPSAAKPTGIGAPVSASELGKKLRKKKRSDQLMFLCQAIATAKPGERNDTLLAASRYAHSFIAAGVPHDWLESQLVAAAGLAGLSTSEAQATIESAFKWSEDKGFGLKGDAKLWHAFSQYYGGDLRYNSRSMFIELDGETEIDPDIERITFSKSCPLVDVAPSASTFANNFIPWAKAENSYDPAVDAVNALPSMTVVEAHTELEELGLVMGLTDIHEITMLKRWLVGMIKRVLEPGCPMSWCLVLAGDGGCGKSSFFEQLAILGLARSVKGVGIGGMDRDELMKAGKSTVFVLDELDEVTRKADMGALKTFIPQSEDTYRIPYDRTDRTHKRGFAVGATVNGSQPLHDDGAGLRRYIVLNMPGKELEGRERQRYYASNAERIQAAALALLKDDFSCQLSKADIETESERKEEYTDRGLIYETAMNECSRLGASIRAAAANNSGYAFHIDQLAKLITDKDFISRTDKLNLEQALRDSGWHVKKQVKIEGRNARLCWPSDIPTKDIYRMFDPNISSRNKY